MFKWIGQYLHNRKAQVQVKQHLSKKQTLRKGIPQLCSSSSSVTSCIKCPRTSRSHLRRWPCIVVQWRIHHHCKLQAAISTQSDRVMGQSWLVKVNEKETTFTISSLSNQHHRVHLKLNGQRLHQEDTPTYLGVTLDQRFTWKNQLQKNQARSKMKKLSFTERGADQNVLTKLYAGRILPVLEYGMAARSTIAKSNSSMLSRVQHQAMRMMTDAMQSTPVSAMETIIGLQPLEDRQEIKVLTQAAKCKRLQDHPMHEHINQPTRRRLKRSNFLQHSRILER